MTRFSTVTCLLLISTLLFLTIASTGAAETVMIEIQDGSIASMTPPELLQNRDYQITVKVTKQGNPVQAAKVELSSSGGIVTIVGDSSATTGSDGVALLKTKFDGGGTVTLRLDGNKVDQLFIYYESIPPLAAGLVGVVLVLLVASLGYLVYTGPLRWYLEEHARK